MISRQRFPEAEKVCREQIAASGEGTAAHAEILDLLVESAWRQAAGQPADAESLALAAVELRSALHGASSLEGANALGALGRTQRNAANLAGARGTLGRAIAIRERNEGHASLALAEDLLALATVERRSNNVELCVMLQERVLAIRKSLLPPRHRDIARAQANLAVAYSSANRRGEARRTFQAALASFDATSPTDSVGLGQCLVLFSSTLLNLNDAKAAHPIALRALDLTSRLVPPDHPRLRDCEATIGYVESGLGRPHGAIFHLSTALAMLDRGSPRDDETRARMLLNLGDGYRDIGKADSAIAIYRVAGRIYRDRLTDRALEAEAWWREGVGHLQRGELAIADSLLSTALDRRTTVAPPEFEAVFGNRFDLAQVKLLSGKTAQAIDLSVQATLGAARAASADIAALTEVEAIARITQRSLDCSYALSGLCVQQDSATVAMVWDAVARTRALTLEELATRRRRAAASGDTVFAALMIRRAILARELSEGYSSRGNGQLIRDRLEDIKRRREEVETSLAARNAGFERDFARSEVGYREFTNGLSSGEALVGFVRFRDWVPAKAAAALTKAGRSGGDGLAAAYEATVARYSAFILLGGQGYPRFVPLGDADRIDLLARNWRRLMGSAGEGGGSNGRARQAGDALRKAIWDPLLGALGGARTALVIPDGELHMVNIAALPTGPGRYLVEAYPTVHMLTSERDIPLLLTPSRSGEGLLAVGGVDFDRRNSPPGSETVVLSRHGDADERRGMRECDPDRRSQLGPLPGTLAEARQAVDRWAETFPREPTALLSGPDATESAVLTRASTARALHLATHGFFTRDCTDHPQGTAPGRPPGLAEESLLRSGIALAGANDRAHPAANGDDGILTAEEIATSDLSSLDWVVLSACESGVGEVASREGVYGLRRAFAVAGAKSLVTSLWEVDDLATKRWMRHLYDARFTDGLPVAEAMRSASMRFLEEQRARGRPTSPDAWGAFIATGAWR